MNLEISAELKQFLIAAGYAKDGDTDKDFSAAAAKAMSDGKLDPNGLVNLSLGKPVFGGVKAADVFGGARVKSASERYSSTKSVGKHARTGQPVCNEHGKQVETPSQVEHAKAGAFLKKLAQRSGLPVELSDHDNALLEECYQGEWVGKIGGNYETGIPGARVKVLLNDNTSGGQELVPAFFDENIITFPLLHSEILPKVDLVPITRGNTVEGASVGNPSIVWSASESTAMTPFTTTGLVGELNTTHRPVTCSIEMGRDFLSDSPSAVGALIGGNIGQAMLSELDRVIIAGNGSTEPSGVIGTAGMIDIGVPVGGSGAPPQVDDYERLLFGIPKQYRTAQMRACFIGNDITYRRARGIPVGSEGARRVFGMDNQTYQVFDHPFCVNASVANNYALFGALAKYRLYRRQAQELRFETGGKTLTLANNVLLVVRGRFGGRVMDANAFAFSDNFQA